MNMFGINRYVAGALIASVLLVWGYVTYRVVAYSHLKRDHKEQAQTINTTKRTQEAVSNLDARLATGETTIDKELCKRGWMASCAPPRGPAIMQLATLSVLADPPMPPATEGGGGSPIGKPSPVDGTQPSPPPPIQPKPKPGKRGKGKAYAGSPCKAPALPLIEK